MLSPPPFLVASPQRSAAPASYLCLQYRAGLLLSATLLGSSCKPLDSRHPGLCPRRGCFLQLQPHRPPLTSPVLRSGLICSS